MNTNIVDQYREKNCSTDEKKKEKENTKTKHKNMTDRKRNHLTGIENTYYKKATMEARSRKKI